MKRYRKKTLALILASAVTVVGAFGAENYKNSLMSIKFKPSDGNAVSMTLFTKQQFNADMNLVRIDDNTHVIVLPETNSELPDKYDIDENIQSIDVSTTPYTTDNKGYTRIVVKTHEHIPLYAKTATYLPSPNESVNAASQSIQNPIQQTSGSTAASNMSTNINTKPVSVQENTIHSMSGVNQTSAVDIKKSVQQFQTATENVEINKTKNESEKTVQKNPYGTVKEEKEINSKIPRDILYLLLGAAGVLAMAMFIIFGAKERMASIIGEQNQIDLKDDSDKDKNKKKSKSTKINKEIKKLDKKYVNPVKMASNIIEEPVIAKPEFPEEANNIIEETVVVDLDELLNEQNRQAENTDLADNEDDSENTSLDDFLSEFCFEEEEPEDNEEKIREQELEEEKQRDEERDFLYNKLIANEELELTKDDINKINAISNKEVSDEAVKNMAEYSNIPIANKKPTPLERMENFVTAYVVKQNISFTKDDIEALNKLINVEIDSSFVTDLKTDPARMKEMQDEIAKHKSRPHKTSEILTLNVKDMLPDLSKALKEQGGRRIESEAKPQVVYYSEGYDVSVLKLDESLPDLAKEVDNDEAYVSRPSDDIVLSDASYDFDTMSGNYELPDLADVLSNPEKYETAEEEQVEVDENALLNNIMNVTFKPFDDGTRKFEIINDIEKEKETDELVPAVDDLQEEFNRLNDKFEIIDKNNTSYESKIDEIAQMAESEEVIADNNLNVDIFDTEEEPDSIAEPEEIEPEESKTESITNPVSEPISETKEEAKTKLPSRPRPAIKIRDSQSDAERLISLIEDIQVERQAKQAMKAKENAESNKVVEENIVQKREPEFCILDNKKYQIVSSSSFTDNMGCYLAKNTEEICIIGFVGDRTFKVKNYEQLDTEKLQTRVSESLDDGTKRYIVRIGIHKFVMNVSAEDMEFVMDLC